LGALQHGKNARRRRRQQPRNHRLTGLAGESTKSSGAPRHDLPSGRPAPAAIAAIDRIDSLNSPSLYNSELPLPEWPVAMLSAQSARHRNPPLGAIHILKFDGAAQPPAPTLLRN